MRQIPWSYLVREMGENLEQEFDSFLTMARRTAAVHARRDPDAIRLTLEISVASGGPREQSSSVEDALQETSTERDIAIAVLEEESQERVSLLKQVADAERRYARAQGAARRLKARLEEINQERRAAADVLGIERIARSAAEAARTVLERERESLRQDLSEARDTLKAGEDAAAELRRLNQDLQLELAEIWRVLRDTRPGELLAITLTLPADEDTRRENAERVQAKIVDARALFKRRSQRWPIAI